MAPSIDSNSTAPAAVDGPQQWRASAVGAVQAPGSQQPPSSGAQQAAVAVGGVTTPPKGVPRVPSLVFDIELEDRGEGQGGPEEEQIGVKELTRWLLPSSTGEAKLRKDVELGLAHNQQHQQHQQQPSPTASAVESNQRLAAFLTRLGYSVSLRTALGGGEGFECLRNLRHVFLAVLPPGAHATTNRFVVDLSFKEQFRIAKPTTRYQMLLDCVPDVYVAPEASVAPLVNFMCHEMAIAFSATGVVLPPWRQTTSMLSKWLPRKSLDEQVPRPMVSHHALPGVTAAAPAAGPLQAIAAAGHRRSVDMAGIQVHGHWVHPATAAPRMQQQQQGVIRAPPPQQQPQQQQQQQVNAAMAAANAALALSRRPSATLVKPLSCEPQRVVVGGNFSTVGGFA